MSDQASVQKVKDLYAAFGRGEIAVLLEAMADDVEWTATTPWNAKSPTTTYRGKAGAQQFFSELDQQFTMKSFAPEEFTSGGDLVVALGRLSGSPKAGGETIDTEWAMAFRFRGDKLAMFKEYSDPTKGLAAFDAIQRMAKSSPAGNARGM
jgi:ketosteroid isomerase-like protein